MVRAAPWSPKAWDQGHPTPPHAQLRAVEEDAGGAFFGAGGVVGAYRAVVELVVVEVDLKERGAVVDLAGDCRPSDC